MNRQYAIDPNQLGKMLNIPKQEMDVLVEGGDHSYDCRCDQCRELWRLIGPDPDTDQYGPFSKEEINE